MPLAEVRSNHFVCGISLQLVVLGNIPVIPGV